MSEDIYVRKDVYDANMAEIRSLMAASEARHVGFVFALAAVVVAVVQVYLAFR